MSEFEGVVRKLIREEAERLDVRAIVRSELASLLTSLVATLQVDQGLDRAVKSQGKLAVERVKKPVSTPKNTHGGVKAPAILAKLAARFKSGESLTLTTDEIARSAGVGRSTMSTVLSMASGIQKMRNGKVGTYICPKGFAVAAHPSRLTKNGKKAKGQRTWTLSKA